MEKNTTNPIQHLSPTPTDEQSKGGKDEDIWTSANDEVFAYLSAAIGELSNKGHCDIMSFPEQKKVSLEESDGLTRQFLDSMARILAPTKDWRVSWKHVTATALQERPSKLNVHIAKNDGFDRRCIIIIKALQQFLREDPDQEVSESSFEDFPAWIAVVEYNIPRLEHYIQELFEGTCDKFLKELNMQSHGSPGLEPKTPSKPCNPQSAFFACLRSFVVRLGEVRTQIVSRPGLRKTVASRQDPLYSILYQADRLSSTYRGQLQCLKRKMISMPWTHHIFTAIERLSWLPRAFYNLDSFRRLHREKESKLEPLKNSPRKPTCISYKKLATVARIDLESPSLSPHKKLDDHIREWVKKEGGFRRSTHCEMQLYEFLYRKSPADRSGIYRYIGTSKSPCWLCWHFLRLGWNEDALTNKKEGPFAFETQPSHCKLYGNSRAPDVDLTPRQIRVLRTMTRKMRELLYQTFSSGRFTTNRHQNTRPDTPSLSPAPQSGHC
ncbi:hypothetical protein SUNI508_03874 [Seiridium unicorne]|uniref:Uncharacterized protein n=1 Tax=Seiridium unicorne TaxID=138068 RepID=A0ABR2VAD2_9PEZI